MGFGIRRTPGRILTINTGSSSLRARLYPADVDAGPILTVDADRIGKADGVLTVRGEGSVHASEETLDPEDHGSAVRALLRALAEVGNDITAVGHRIVHGGSRFAEPHVVTDDALSELRRLVPLAPSHLPRALDAVDITRAAFPAAPQVLCFDTAFHRAMPRVARLYPLPRRFADYGVVRYGFHGLSYESIVHQLRAAGDASAGGRLVVAHLGNGASMAALRDGASVDTTMGFTPSGGLMMGTRAGDLDPGLLVYLLDDGGLNASSLNALVNREAGLLGVSGSSADMRDLLAREATDPHAAEAVALFCYLAKKQLGALVAVLGGLDTLVFTGGIGEHAAPVRARICAGLDVFGIEIAAARNAAPTGIVSTDGATVTVRAMHTDEDLMIARHTRRLIQGEAHVPV